MGYKKAFSFTTIVVSDKLLIIYNNICNVDLICLIYIFIKFNENIGNLGCEHIGKKPL